MDALLQGVEVLATLVGGNHDLAVEHVTAGGKGELGEVARQRLAAARLQVHVRALHERDRPEPVVLGLEGPALAVGQLPAREGELRLDGRGEREGHAAQYGGAGARSGPGAASLPIPHKANQQRTYPTCVWFIAS